MVEKAYSIENRRYIGSKAKLADWIFSIIKREAGDARTFCDIFAGTGVISAHALKIYRQVIINDFLYSNYAIYQAFFGQGEWKEEILQDATDFYNSIDVDTLNENYFSENYGGKYFEYSLAKKIGFIRDDIEEKRSKLTKKEYYILLTSLIYSIDRQANTLGHFDAYIKKTIMPRKFLFNLIEPHTFENAKIYREDANKLAREIQCDVVYIDPPYNSRQYSRFYHVYENLVKWSKPTLYGVAMKPKPENMSAYCHSNALDAFKDLVNKLDTHYIAVSYNNTYNPKSKSSKNKISFEDLLVTLKQRGMTTVFSHKYNAFQAGKTEMKNHKEFLFVTKIN